MANDYFRFKQFTINQGSAAFKVTTDSVLLGAWADLASSKTILDIGTGTGILALMAAQRTNAMITAIEPDKQSFNQALLNIMSSPWAERVQVVNCTLQDFSGDSGLKFDSIITNPPYFTSSLLNPDRRKAMARHTKTLSLTELSGYSEQLLTENGQLHLVLPAADFAFFNESAQTNGLWCQRMLKVSPVISRQPKRLLMSFGRKKITTEEKSLVIETGVRHHYSDEYISLTRDFYLDK